MISEVIYGWANCPYAAYAARPTPHSASRPEPRPCKRAHPAPNGAARAARVRTRGTPDSSLCAAATQVAQGANPHAALLAVGLESNPKKLQNIKKRARKLKASFEAEATAARQKNGAPSPPLRRPSR